MIRRRLAINSIALVLFVNLLTSAVAWTFHGEVYAHEFDHHRAVYELDHHHHTTLAQPKNIEHHHHTVLEQSKNIEHHQHNDMIDDDILDSIIHLSLHAAGQNQPFYTTLPSLIPSVTGKEILAVFFPTTVLKPIQDSPFRPPRNTSVS